jgi:hypothetical protein
MIWRWSRRKKKKEKDDDDDNNTFHSMLIYNKHNQRGKNKKWNK